MDPTTALEHVLRGHRIADHARDLHAWFRYGGAPVVTVMPTDAHDFFVWHCVSVHADSPQHYPGYRCVRANCVGIWTYAPHADEWFYAASYPQLFTLFEPTIPKDKTP